MPAPDADPILLDEDLPAMFHAADAASLSGQRHTVRWMALQLGLLIIGAASSGLNIQFNNGLNVASLVATISLACSLLPAAWMAIQNPQQRWYQGRAAAESVKTLAWKYAVRAAPFADDDTASERRLQDDLSKIPHNLQDIRLLTSTEAGGWISDGMRALRKAPLGKRRAAYLSGRLDGEYAWYRRKAGQYAIAARRWTAFGIAATTVGLIAGLLRSFNVFNYDGLGAASAVAAAAVGWSQLKQFRPLAAAYELTSHELRLVKAGLVDVDDELQWAKRCAEAEDAISREHTMWLARREAS